MSASIVQAELTRMNLSLEFAERLPRTLLNSDPNVDDPVNDTGLAPHRGDLQNVGRVCLFAKKCP